MTAAEIIAGMTANVLTHILFYSIDKVKRVVGASKDREEIIDPGKIHQFTQKAIAKLNCEFEWNSSSIQIEESSLFLLSHDVETLMIQAFTVICTEPNNAHLQNNTREKFHLLYSVRYGADQANRDKTDLDALYNNIMGYFKQTLREFVESDNLLAHEILSHMRTNQILKSLESIKESVDFLRKNKSLNNAQIDNVENKIRQQVNLRHCYIRPAQFDTSKRFPIDKLYVPPIFQKHSSPDESKKLYHLSGFLTATNRVVVLGNPGNGKSTLTEKICFELSGIDRKKSIAGRNYTPIQIIIRDYAKMYAESSASILSFVTNLIKSKYQIHECNDTVTEFLLCTGRVLLIFDGLDELIDTRLRQTISENIESFGSLYCSCPIIITSRFVGYFEAPLKEDEYDVFFIQEFNTEQVEKYVTNWFSTDEELSEEVISTKTHSFLEESKIISDIRSNPLMLSLLCNIYRGENYIPTNRPDIYSKCAEMLFDRWDKSRGITVVLPFTQHIKPAMMHLAHWIFTNEDLQNGVTEHKLIQTTTKYLLSKRFDDHDEAEQAAKEFVIFCRGRAWVFSDTGTTSSGERLYQFTHRTFLEYFTACYISRTHRTPNELISILKDKTAKSEWDVVLMLSIQIKNKEQEDAGDEILNMLTEESCLVDNQQRVNILSFTARCLEFITPSPQTLSSIITTIFEHFVNTPDRHNNQNPYKLPVLFLNNSNHDNRTAIIKIAIAALQDTFNKAENNKEKTALAVIHLPIIQRNYFKKTSQKDLLHKIMLHFINSNKSELTEISKKDIGFAAICYYSDIINTNQLLEFHGITALFFYIDGSQYGFSRMPISDYCLYYLKRSKKGVTQKITNTISDLGTYYSQHASDNVIISLLPKHNTDHRVPLYHPSSTFSKLIFHTDSATSFGMLIILLSLVEILTHENDNSSKATELNALLKLKTLSYLYESRKKHTLSHEAKKVISKLMLTPKQAKIITNWCTNAHQLTTKSV